LSQPGAVHDAVLQAEPLPAGAARAARAEVAAEYHDRDVPAPAARSATAALCAIVNL